MNTNKKSLGLTEKIVLLHKQFKKQKLPHAFGGALALAWCTGQARGTIDIDVNIFVGTDELDKVLEALPADIEKKTTTVRQLKKDGQARFWWENSPVDIFLDTTNFHIEVKNRIILENFAGEPIPFLSCQDLAVFKAFFNRTKDWADLEAMMEAGTIDTRQLTGVLSEFLGADDERISRIKTLKSK